MPKVMNQNHNLMKMLQAITKEAKLILRELEKARSIYATPKANAARCSLQDSKLYDMGLCY